MKKIFLTSGLVMCMACPAFATYDINPNQNGEGFYVDKAQGDDTNYAGHECVEPVLGESEQGATVQLEAKWNANKSGAITLISSVYPSNNTSSSALYTTSTAEAVTGATPTPIYSIYANGFVDSNDATVSSISIPSKTGYTFDGFFDGNTQLISNAGAFVNNADQRITSTGGTGTWYAHWTPKTYNVSYNSGLHGSSTATPDPVDPVTYTGGLTYDATWTSKTLAQNNFEVDPGYSFVGWNTAQDGSGTSYTAGAEQSAWHADNGLNLYAIYSANGYTISYAHGTAGSRSTGFSGSMSTQNVTFDQNATLTANAFTIPGYHFNQWEVVDPVDGEAETYAGGYEFTPYNLAHSLSLEATWTANATTVSFDCAMDNTTDANSQSVYTGSPATASAQATYDSSFAFAAQGTCARTGWTFAGWTCKSGNTTLTMADVYGTTGDNASDTVLPANSSATWLYTGTDGGSISCVAQYTANTINVNWYTDSVANNGTKMDVDTASESCVYDGNLVVPAAPNKTGYTFTGWTVRPAAQQEPAQAPAQGD